MNYIKRLSKPSSNDKNYIHYSKSGYNYCIQIKSTGSVLANCTGYAWGRWRELLGKFHELSRGNAEVWWGKGDGYDRSQTPKLGSVVCWRQGVAGNSNDGLGHVAIVEEIKDNGDIIISQSAYNGSEFYISTVTKAGNYTYKPGFVLQGFIHLPVNFKEVIEDVVVKPNPSKSNSDIANEVKKGIWGNGSERIKRLESAGYVYKDIQAIVNGWSTPTTPPPVVKSFKVGDTVTLKLTSKKWQTGSDIPSWAKGKSYKIERLQDNYAVLSGIKSRAFISDIE